MKKTKANQNAKKSSNKAQRKKAIRISLIVIAVLISSVGIYFGYGIFKQIDGFSKEKLLSQQSTVLLDTNENEYFSYARDGARKNVKYEDIPQVMIDAVVAAEDSRFFEHNGFDLPRIVKALMGNITAGRITGGGSTITQQVIKKSYYPKEEQTIERKVGEIILAIEATTQTTKEEILELYLNKIYFGYGNKAIGIYAASRYYFDKKVQELTLPEAALLAGAINNPNIFDPFKNLSLATKRRNTILNLMRDHGYITSEECELTKAIPVENTLKYNPITSGGKYQAYADKVYREVEEMTGLNPHNTAMRIHTYIDTQLQEKLDELAYGNVHKFVNKDAELGATVLESTTGRIIGIISGRNYEPLGLTYAYAGDKKTEIEKGLQYGQRNSPGSSLKPIVAYASAFEFLNYSTAHYVTDAPLDPSLNYNPKNWNGTVHGDMTIKEALMRSWNLPAIRTFWEVLHGNGIDKGIGANGVYKYMEGFGFDMYGEEKKTGEGGFAIGNWNYGVSTEELAGAYAAIASGGTYTKPHTVSKIEILSTGEVIDLESQYQAEKKTAISQESAYMIRDIMLDYVDEYGTYAPFNFGYQIGAKTGTSTFDKNDGALAGKSKDSWMTAFSPDYTLSVWVGHNSSIKKALINSSDANKVAAIIAKYVHTKPLQHSYPSVPDGITKETIISGIYPYVSAGEGVPSNRMITGWFKKSNLPSGTANGASLNNLDSFTATNNNGKIDVTFSEYNPKSMTENGTPTKVYTDLDGKTYTLPYYGDITQIYGKVVYVVEVVDATGQIVHSEKLSTNQATLNFTPSSGTYTVNGYYAYESGQSTSNHLSQSVTITSETVPTPGATYSQIGELTNQKLVLQVNVPTGSQVVIEINGASQTINTSGLVNIDLSKLIANQDYTITFTEITAAGQVNILKSFTFKRPA